MIPTFHISPKPLERRQIDLAERDDTQLEDSDDNQTTKRSRGGALFYEPLVTQNNAFDGYVDAAFTNLPSNVSKVAYLWNDKVFRSTYDITKNMSTKTTHTSKKTGVVTKNLECLQNNCAYKQRVKFDFAENLLIIEASALEKCACAEKNIKKNTKQFISNILNNKQNGTSSMKPIAITRQVSNTIETQRKNGEESSLLMVSKKAISNIKYRQNISLYGKRTATTVEQLETWCSRHLFPSNYEDDDFDQHSAFVTAFSIKPTMVDGNVKYVVDIQWSTKCLLNIAPKENYCINLHSDTTHGTNALGYKLHQLCVSDRARHSHITAFGLSSNETHENFYFQSNTRKRMIENETFINSCMSDGAEAIQNGVLQAYNTVHHKRLMCGAHVYRVSY